MKRRKICVVTTSRAEFGLLSGLMKAIKADPVLQLQVIASGMHLESGFGQTWRDIQGEGIRIDRKVRMRLTGSSEIANVNSLSLGLKGFGKAITELKPDILVLLGDRFELLAPATAALMLQIPIAHIHGGELTEGAIDDAVRHALTKMASLHFPATEIYRRRILQMGEDPSRVFNFGAPGLDQLHNATLLTRSQLESELDFPLNGPVAIVTYHPVTRGAGNVDAQVHHLLSGIRSSGIRALFTMANADAQGAKINARLQAECEASDRRFKWAPHLGHRRYLSCLKYVSVMVGNSSSGLTEAPSFRLPVVNVGDRQEGRVRAQNVIDVPCTQDAIKRGISRALSSRFRTTLRRMQNPYARYRDGQTSERIKNVLRDTDISAELLKKHFNDLDAVSH
jgi:UDP-N-acetylglucosamine 2-epimerase (non-hydrolysing)/GDP/UDP-N,N'-diacetylbacillosamine 2-epimerase (hydrolysing)